MIVPPLGRAAVRPIVPDYTHYRTVLEPDRNQPDWWAGAPSVARDREGAIWLACRMREGDSPRGERGYEVRLLRSEDGYRFEPVKSIRREEAGTVSFERPALLIDPLTFRIKLYLCRAGKPGPGGWRIDKLDDVDDPADFDPATARPVITAPCPNQTSQGVKDPFCINIGGVYFMFYIGYGWAAPRELPFLSTSMDGEHWAHRRDPLLPHAGWHDFFTRPSFLLPAGPLFLFYYEGSNQQWFDPVYNIQGGIAVTFDLQEFADLTPDAPLFRSSTPGRYETARYTDYLVMEDRVLFYYEAARPNDSNEIRVSEAPLW